MDLLPREIWLHIFSFVDEESLKNVVQINTEIAELMTDELFWFQKCRRGKHYLSAFVFVHRFPTWDACIPRGAFQNSRGTFLAICNSF